MTTVPAPEPGSTLPSTMSDQPLAISAIFEHAIRAHAPQAHRLARRRRVVRFTYAQFGRRVAQLAHALRALGIGPGDRVASFAWNGHRHLELYFAVPMIGAVLHTVNIRLFADQVSFVLDHAGDRAVFLDASLVKAIKPCDRTRIPRRDRAFVVMGEASDRSRQQFSYEELLAAETDTYDWPEFDERSAALLCYTSATTGDPKGVLYSHRSTYIHALAIGLIDAMGIGERDRMLPIVPLFHVNAWGTPFPC